MKTSVKEGLAAMVFAPKPENDFAQFIYTYYETCRSHFDGVEAIAGKWMFRDLLPGMSDFDTRLIVREGMTPEDWCRMSTAIGEAHLALCQKYCCWARNLEHLPGINLAWSELTSEETYYPEYQLWSFYYTAYPSRVGAVLGRLAKRPWDTKDEYFHLKRFCSYFGRYDRSIDPPINLGAHENKYPLHSRLMHYFTPAVQSAVSLLEKRNITGKFDALELAQRRFPKLKCWYAVNEILHEGYEIPRWYHDPLLSELEDQLEGALQVMAADLRSCLTLVPEHLRGDVTAWKQALQSVPISPALAIFESMKFSRLMKGRLRFYAEAPSHFKTSWLIGNELNRMGRDFFRTPFRTYWEIKTGELTSDPITILDHLGDDLLTPTEVAATKEFARLTPGYWDPGEEKAIALAITGVFDDFYKALTKLADSVYRGEIVDAER